MEELFFSLTTPFIPCLAGRRALLRQEGRFFLLPVYPSFTLISSQNQTLLSQLLTFYKKYTIIKDSLKNQRKEV